MRRLLTLFFLTSLPTLAQYTIPSHTGATVSGGSLNLSVGATLLQDEGSISIIANCASTSTSCTFGIPPVTSGSEGIITIYTGNSNWIASASITGGTFSACPSGGSGPNSELCSAFNASVPLAEDAMVETGHTAGTSQVTVTLHAAASGGFIATWT